MTSWSFYSKSDVAKNHPDALKAIVDAIAKLGYDFDKLRNDMIYQTSNTSPLYVSMVDAEAMKEITLTCNLSTNEVSEIGVDNYDGDIGELEEV